MTLVSGTDIWLIYISVMFPSSLQNEVLILQFDWVGPRRQIGHFEKGSSRKMLWYFGHISTKVCHSKCYWTINTSWKPEIITPL